MGPPKRPNVYQIRFFKDLEIVVWIKANAGDPARTGRREEHVASVTTAAPSGPEDGNRHRRRLDLLYVGNWSLGLDPVLLANTAHAVTVTSGANPC